MGSPFVFYTELRLVVLTGVRAGTLAELRAGIATVPGSSIFYHTHHQYLARHFQKPVYYNDFAVWASETLRDEALGEKLAALDLLVYTTVRDLREALIGSIDRHLADESRAPSECPPGRAFHFCRSRSFALPSRVVAGGVDDFFEKLGHVSNASVYFHFFESRLRLGAPTSDFARWLADQGRADLAAAIDSLNPYSRTLDELKRDIIEIGQRQAGRR